MPPTKKSFVNNNDDENNHQTRFKYTNAPYQISLTRPYPPPKTSNDNNYNNCSMQFVFQNNFDYTSSSSSSSSTCLSLDNLDSLIDELMTNPPYQLTLSIEELLAPAKRKSSETPPRPQNVFILFRKDLVAKIKNEFPEFAKNLRSPEHSKTAKTIWEIQPNEVKQFFQVLYLACIEKHKEMYPKYQYVPKPRVRRVKKLPVIEPSRKVSKESRRTRQNSQESSTNSEDSFMSEFFDFTLWDSHQK
ncbi:10289_t:CDS:1 [Funneliformis geosporum]|uniref:16157_t:CDS:1 n=1 Tax=Funneliformis geosporum TaxID=1117311 RepID=A0A9W4SJ87_9GLOM|nr:10289_t:CDS:1 [Funneliformis geosporum]CAI2170445.1 16157_t:CDS:1 [Funneliformis geosporum]